MQTPLRAELTLAVDLALRAGQRMEAYCDARGTAAESGLADLDIAYKGKPQDFCTIVDVENERMITEGIRKQFATHQIIGEETVGTGPIPLPSKDGAPTWIIDPIDGTTNFAAGLPLTCVSIGLCVNRTTPVMGVVYAPATDELYLAVAGAGAYRNGVRITRQTAANANATKRLDDAVVCFEFGYARDAIAVARMVAAVGRLLEHGCRTTRSLGSGVLDLCYVATGRLDAVYAGVAGEGWKPWDHCAGVAIVREAGGVVQAISPPPGDDATDQGFDLYSDSIICAVNLPLLEDVRETITGVTVPERMNV